MKYFRVFLGLGMSVILSSTAWSAVPNLMNLQGTLTDAGGSPIRNSTVSVQFKIYDTTAAGTALWSETQASVATDNQGSFNVLLGSVTPIPDAVFSDTDRWLGIKVAADPEMTPRTRLVSVGYAYRVNSVDGASGGSINGNLSLLDNGSLKSRLYGQGYGQLLLHDLSGDAVVDLSAGIANGGKIALTQEDGTSGVLLEGGTTTLGSTLTMRNGPGNATFTLDADHTTVVGDVGAFLSMTDGTYTTVHLDASGVDGGAQFSLIDSDGETTFSLDAESGVDGGARMELRDGTSVPSKSTIILDAQSGTGAGALLTLRDAAGTDQIYLDANWGGTGRSRIWVDELQINGADLSEQFDVKAENGIIKPGMLVCIDAENPGKLILSYQAYDHKVAGVISGAGGIKPGMYMGQAGSIADGTHPVALTGRVYCWADASQNPIRPGDLLTTSAIPGHAMKVADYNKAQGAIMGKAMSSLEKGKGLVLVLVNLQ